MNAWGQGTFISYLKLWIQGQGHEAFAEWIKEWVRKEGKSSLWPMNYMILFYLAYSFGFGLVFNWTSHKHLQNCNFTQKLFWLPSEKLETGSLTPCGWKLLPVERKLTPVATPATAVFTDSRTPWSKVPGVVSLGPPCRCLLPSQHLEQPLLQPLPLPVQMSLLLLLHSFVHSVSKMSKMPTWTFMEREVLR